MQIYGKLAVGAAFVMALTMTSNALAIPSGQHEKSYEDSNNSSSWSINDIPSSYGKPHTRDKNLFSKDSHENSGTIYDHEKKEDGHYWTEGEEYERDHNYGTVPEPASLLLIGSGLAGLGIWRRKAS